ncbi:MULTISPECIES: KilA-N domain-containing protein [Pseudomonas]|uniref:KilA-N domain-containing protein n=1 Tax=Pseudomonas TaxID=286 RepID=UPI001297B8F4|nr:MULTISPECIES: KilA-N domain-containing protein [Pseudomonas]MDI3185186.1 KilA-N domain-containing protein [Pseudomonas paracarnis]MQT51722.1 KilA-N domain-containing protein [Pseudomonas sp. FSL R10-2398]
MTARIIPFDYEGQAVRFNGDGWLHATEIAERFGKKPAHWLELDTTGEYIRRLSHRMAESNIGKSDITLVKTRRGNTATSGTWLHPKLAVKFARWLSVDFEIWCDEQVDALLRGESKPWAIARREAAIGHKAVCDAIALNCEAQGKTPQKHHFINEARLINQVVTGSFAGRDRDQLNTAELELVTLAELRDTALICGGMAYADRKANLLAYVAKLQGKHQRRIAA